MTQCGMNDDNLQVLTADGSLKWVCSSDFEVV